MNNKPEPDIVIAGHDAFLEIIDALAAAGITMDRVGKRQIFIEGEKDIAFIRKALAAQGMYLKDQSPPDENERETMVISIPEEQGD